MDLDKDLNLNSVVEIVKMLAANTEVEQASRCFSHNGVKYAVVKSGNSFTIKTSEGKELSVLIDYQRIKDDRPRNGLDVYYDKHTVDATWAIGDDEYLNLFSTIALDEGYTSFENIQRHNLHETGSFEFSFVNAANEKVAELSTTLNGVKLAGKTHKYTFNGDTITTDNMVINLDNLKLLQLDGQKVPSMKTIISFNVEKEKKTINNFVKYTLLYHIFIFLPI